MALVGNGLDNASATSWLNLVITVSAAAAFALARTAPAKGAYPMISVVRVQTPSVASLVKALAVIKSHLADLAVPGKLADAFIRCTGLATTPWVARALSFSVMVVVIRF